MGRVWLLQFKLGLLLSINGYFNALAFNFLCLSFMGAVGEELIYLKWFQTYDKVS